MFKWDTELGTCQSLARAPVLAKCLRFLLEVHFFLFFGPQVVSRFYASTRDGHRALKHLDH